MLCKMSKNIELPYRIGIIYPTIEMNEREWNVDIFFKTNLIRLKMLDIFYNKIKILVSMLRTKKNNYAPNRHTLY